MSATTTSAVKRTRKAKAPRRFPYPPMPRDWFTRYLRHNKAHRPIEDVAEQEARGVVEKWGATLSGEHKEALYLYSREAALGDWTALVALADMLTDADDFDPAEHMHPASVVLHTAAKILRLHLEEHKEYRRGRSKRRGGNPLAAFQLADYEAADDNVRQREAALALIADRMTHGEAPRD